MEDVKMNVALLHCHTVYSVMDATAKAEEYALKTVEYNENSSKYNIVGIGITEHGNTYSKTSARVALEKKKLQHIFGCETYCVEDEFNTKEGIRDIKNRHHLVLYPMNGHHRDFTKLMTMGGFNKTKRSKEYQVISESMLEQYGEGLIGTSACCFGIVGSLILQDKLYEAREKIIKYNEMLGQFYLEVQPHSHPEQIKLNKALVELSEELSIPLVMGLDAHYVTLEDKSFRDSYVNMMQFSSADKKKKEQKQNNDNEDLFELYLRSFEELEAYCLEYDIPLSALSNTGVIAKACDKIDFKPKDMMQYMPEYKVPVGYTIHDYLTKITFENFYKKIRTNKCSDVKKRIERINHELRVIEKTGFSGYFLILWDWVKAMREKDIMIGPGRGSSAGLI